MRPSAVDFRETAGVHVRIFEGKIFPLMSLWEKVLQNFRVVWLLHAHRGYREPDIIP